MSAILALAFVPNLVHAQSKVCDFVPDADGAKTQCLDCFNRGDHSWTAIGCIPTTPAGFVGQILSFGLGIAGGIAFLLILSGGFQILTSAGNPEQLNAGKELIGSAIAGLLMIIFSVFLLRFIGVDVLRIPGFS